jgi:hypothetical protein
LRTFLCSARGDQFIAVGGGLQRHQTTVTWGLPSGLGVTSVASAAEPMKLRAASSRVRAVNLPGRFEIQ